MKEPKTRPTDEDPALFIDSRVPENHRADSHRLMALLAQITGEKPIMWGEAIIGYGSYLPPQKGAFHWPQLAFSPRKAAIVIYIMGGSQNCQDILHRLDPLNRLGKHTMKGACLHIKRLSDINIDVLAELCLWSYKDTKPRFT